MTILLLIGMIAFSGCSTLTSWFDWDGNGRIDPIAYLENSDITVAWVDEQGQSYNIAVDELGKQLLGQFIQAKTGYLFELTDEGGITVTDPNGVKIQIARKASS